MHHMTVSQDEAVGSEGKARSSAFAARLLHLDVNDRRTDPLHGADDRARITVQQLEVRT